MLTMTHEKVSRSHTCEDSGSGVKVIDDESRSDFLPSRR
jgi:hypothetical protein